jgi:hypothetical protein
VSAIEERRNDCVDPGVQLFDAGDGGLDQLGRRHLPFADELCLPARVEFPKLAH